LADKNPPTFEIPADLDIYLPPDLWRKLSRGKPQRKVLIQAHDRLRSLLYLLSTFIPSNLVQEKMKRPVPGLVKGSIVKGSLLFADVSGFTALSERLAVLGPEGAERLTVTMNNYFSTMLEILAWSGGILLKFAGDAMLVYFPHQAEEQQASWAVRAGVRMLTAISKFSNIETPLETISLKMKIGVATGEFLSASVGSRQRMEYAILGEAISQTMGAESAATGPGQLVINQATADCLDESFPLAEQAPGYCRIDLDTFADPDSYEIKAEKRRARGAISFDASPEAILGLMQDTLDQIHALRPYIAHELVERIIAQAQRRRFDSQFLLTTVMFCNFDGLEKLLDIWGAKGASRITNLLSAYISAMSDVISRYGGMISRIDPYSKGTKLLALFGAPVSHQDDPLRAVRAALMMNAELQTLNERWKHKFSRHLPKDWDAALIQHRIGITEGETFAGPVGAATRREYTVMGDDVNLSARLMGASKMGQILISQPVYQAVGNYFFHTDLPPIKVKGKSQPIPLYQVDGPRTDTLLNRVQQRGRLVGRAEEYAQAEELLAQALGGTCTSLTILGPAGIGKSHLADTLLKAALTQGAEVLSYQCKAYNTELSYACWSGILRSLAGITSSDPYLLHKEKFQHLLTKFELAEQQAGQLANLVGLDTHDTHEQPAHHAETQREPKEAGVDLLLDISRGKGSRRRGSSLDLLGQLDKQQNFETSQMGFRVPTKLSPQEQDLLVEALSHLLAQLLEKSPQVLFFEDAHWMDAASRRVLLRLQETLASAPLMTLLAQRGEQEGATDKSDDEPIPLVHTLTLGPLDNAATTELVADVLISNLAQIVHQHSQGSPLFIRQIAYWIQQTWEISTTEVINALQTSDILQNLVLSSLESLPENQRQIARIGSVIGEEFRGGELQALLPSSVDTVTLYNDLRALVEARFFSLVEAGVDPRYAFQQKLVRDVLYNSLPFARRRELHTTMASYLSSSPSQRAQIHSKISAFLDADATSNPAQEARIVAHHYQAAELWEKAARSWQTAADHLIEQDAYTEAIETYQRALENVGKSGNQKSLKQNLIVGVADAAFLGGDYAQAAQNYRLVLNMDQQIEVKRKLALVLPLHGKTDEALDLLQESGKTSETEPGLATAATLTWLLWRSGSEDSAAWIEKSMAQMPSNPNTWEKGIQAILYDFIEDWQEALNAYQAINQPIGVGLATLHLGDQNLQANNATQALQRYQAAAEVFEKVAAGEPEPGLALAQYRQAEAYWRMNDNEAARVSLNDAQKYMQACQTSISDEGLKLVVNGLKMISEENKQPWPAWHWQTYDDSFRIKLLFHR
jgi:class 3 adenylate cyclase/tetratricopeptide (TPR) repeat protein